MCSCLPAWPAVVVEYPRIMAAQAANQIHFNGPVLLTNALTAFALNLVSASSSCNCSSLRDRKGLSASNPVETALPLLLLCFIGANDR